MGVGNTSLRPVLRIRDLDLGGQIHIQTGKETSRPEVDVFKKLLLKLAYWE
jgi:hypothetical protein